MVDTWIWIGLLCIVVGLSLPHKKTSGGIVRRRAVVGGQQSVISDQRSATSAAVQAVRPTPVASAPETAKTKTGFVLPDEHHSAYVSPEFLDLFEHRSDSIEAQDAYHTYLFKNSRVIDAVGYELTDEQARTDMQSILSSPIHDRAKDALLEVLQIDVQNHGERGLASPVISEIMGEQYELIKKYQKGDR